jgi:hypothetical protein
MDFKESISTAVLLDQSVSHVDIWLVKPLAPEALSNPKLSQKESAAWTHSCGALVAPGEQKVHLAKFFPITIVRRRLACASKLKC